MIFNKYNPANRTVDLPVRLLRCGVLQGSLTQGATKVRKLTKLGELSFKIIFIEIYYFYR